MIKSCPICGTQFETHDLRKRYCSNKCAYQGRVNSNNKRMEATRTANKRAWAMREAHCLNHLAYECGVDELADYIYNNYNQRKK